MNSKQTARIAFASGMLSLGVVVLIFGDFAQVWHSLPKWVPGRQALAYASAVFMLVGGLGLLWKRTESPTARALFYYWVALVVLTQLPVVIKHPLIEVAWQGIAHLGMLVAAAWMMTTTNPRAVRAARILFGLTLIPIGLAHFVYFELTAPIIPNWIPFHTFWAYFTGAAQLAAALGVLLGVYARLAAALDAVLMALFTFVVWPPMLIAAPTKAGLWSEFTISWALTTAAWVVAAYMVNEDSTSAPAASAE